MNDITSKVKLATSLLWAGLGIEILVALWHWRSSPPAYSAGLLFLIMVAIFLFAAFLIRKIAEGQNWARIVYLVLFLLGLSNALKDLPGLFNQSLLGGLSGFVQMLLPLVALVLLFTPPGSDHFGRRIR